jgi:tetratricopeptide (TPR) repeat protein
VQAASVIKEPLSYALLGAALGEETALSEELMRTAVAAGLLRVGATRGQFTFGPRLLFDAAYETIPPSQRKTLHARIATHLRALLDTLGEAAVHAASYHAYMGYHDERAVPLLLRSARLYHAQYANRQALVSASRALEIVTGLPHPEEFLETRLDCLLLTAQSYQVLGELENAEGALTEAEALGEDCANRELLAQILTARATLAVMQGKVAEAYEDFRRAREEWEKLGVEERVGHGLLGMGVCARQEGRSAEAAELFTEATARSGDALWVKAAALNNLGMLWLSQGLYQQAESPLRAGLEANEAEEDRRGVAHSLASLGELYFRLGRCAEAADCLRGALARAEEIEDQLCLNLATVLLARTQALQGSPEEAAQTLAAHPVSDPHADLEAAVLGRMAALETGLAGASEQSAPVSLAPAATGPEALWNLPGAASVDLRTELICVELEAALVRGDEAATGELTALLAQRVPALADRHVQRYARWLLAAAGGERQQLRPFTAGRGPAGSCFVLRARRLRAALRAPCAGNK